MDEIEIRNTVNWMLTNKNMMRMIVSVNEIIMKGAVETSERTEQGGEEVRVLRLPKRVEISYSDLSPYITQYYKKDFANTLEYIGVASLRYDEKGMLHKATISISSVEFLNLFRKHIDDITERLRNITVGKRSYEQRRPVA